MRRLLFVFAGLAGLVLAVAGRAGVETDPNQNYVVTPEAGPWMICAACFVGPEAPKLAQEMIVEIRTRHNLPAYVFDRSAEERRKQEEERRRQQQELERLLQLYPEAKIPHGMGVRTTRVQEQCVVLIGGYPSMDAASRALKQIKKLPPPSSERLMPIVLKVAATDKVEDQAQAKGAYTYANPYAKSFVTRNPTVPQERPQPPKNDPIYKKLNAHEPYSLLKSPKPWTLVVATYQGLSIIEPKEADNPGLIEKLEKMWTSSQGQMLDASAQNAQNLAKALHTALRALKSDDPVYVLHTRWGSLVTVGGFDRVDDPRMALVQRTLASLRMEQVQGYLPRPMPMEVPRP